MYSHADYLYIDLIACMKLLPPQLTTIVNVFLFILIILVFIGVCILHVGNSKSLPTRRSSSVVSCSFSLSPGMSCGRWLKIAQVLTAQASPARALSREVMENNSDKPLVTWRKNMQLFTASFKLQVRWAFFFFWHFSQKKGCRRYNHLHNNTRSWSQPQRSYFIWRSLPFLWNFLISLIRRMSSVLNFNSTTGCYVRTLNTEWSRNGRNGNWSLL